ncbi:MAG: ATP phosphoribosyltransferase regulatory subunit [Clostridia bacterium]|nr:ATP phosphoribosyltransferase regulatory subunit [Clostridia bacterium]
MEINIDILSKSEQLALALRTLYAKNGYSYYRMSRFEELELYTGNRDFLVSPDILTFTDKNGRLMALKPDVTLSIVKSRKDDPDALDKLCYSESVFRVPKEADSFREISQTGVECIGNVTDDDIADVTLLASRSLDIVSEDNVLVVSDLDILNRLITATSDKSDVQKKLIQLAGQKNVDAIRKLAQTGEVDQKASEALESVLLLSGTGDEVLNKLGVICEGAGCGDLCEAFSKTIAKISAKLGSGKSKLRIDFSVTGDLKYYNGIVFCGFVKGVHTGILSGGRYDGLMAKLGKKSKAIGFAVRTDIGRF